MSSGCFYLLKFNHREQMLDVLDRISEHSDIKSWNAVDGHFGLVVTADNNELSGFFNGLGGFAEMASCEVRKVGSEKERPEENAYAYLFIETDQQARSAIFNRLDAMSEVYFCADTSGDFSIVAVIGGDDFNAIDRLVESEIQTLPGLLRMKQDRLIYLDHI